MNTFNLKEGSVVAIEKAKEDYGADLDIKWAEILGHRYIYEEKKYLWVIYGVHYIENGEQREVDYLVERRDGELCAEEVNEKEKTTEKGE